MSLVRAATFSLRLVFAVSVVACSSDGEGSISGASSSGGGSSGASSSGESTSGSSGDPSSEASSSGSTNTEQTCSSSAVNGVCAEGPNKGTSCCMPDEDEGTTCEQGTDCDTVCRYCE